jgi:hypothetical protein
MVKNKKLFEVLICGVLSKLLKKSKSFLYIPYGMPYIWGFALFLPIFVRGKRWG